MSTPSIFPPTAPKGLPCFSTLLVSGQYHPSAPVHLALSLQHKTIIIHPSRMDFQADLLRFNDAWLISRSSHGKITDLSSKIDIFYPPTAAHLCMLLSVLCVSNSGNMGSTLSTTKIGFPHAVILVEPSRFFFSNSHSNSESLSTLSSYLNIIQRAVACILFRSTRTTSDTQRVVLFESRLQELKVPLTNQLSIYPESHNPHQPRQVQALLIVEKYFELVGILEDDTFYIPSSQNDEMPESSEGARKQLRLYHPDEPFDSYIHCRWSEKTCSTEGVSGTWFMLVIHPAILQKDIRDERQTSTINLVIKSNGAPRQGSLE